MSSVRDRRCISSDAGDAYVGSTVALSCHLRQLSSSHSSFICLLAARVIRTVGATCRGVEDSFAGHCARTHTHTYLHEILQLHLGAGRACLLPQSSLAAMRRDVGNLLGLFTDLGRIRGMSRVGMDVFLARVGREEGARNVRRRLAL